MTIDTMKEVEQLFSSLPPTSAMPQGDQKRARRRRKKAKADEGEGGEFGKKRRLNDEQVKFLELNFGKERKLESGRKVHLAAELGLDPKQVAVWFQNRRARWKNKQLEEEYMKLKSEHDATIVEKCHLENEVMKLKNRVSEAEEEIKRVSAGRNGASNGGSPSSSSTCDNTTQRQPFLGEFAVEGDELMYINEYSNYIMEWGYLFGM